MDKKIKWGCIQPLTGGMYLGAQKAIGYPAEFIISYPGLCDKIEKDGEIYNCNNEYHLLKYLEKHNELPQYKVFNKTPFEIKNIEDITLNSVAEFTDESKEIDFYDIDIIVSVPVCSGLSQATIASDNTKQSKNCNMIFNAEYSLSVIKPKIYIFENAPALYNSERGQDTRNILNTIAEKYNYSITYYKTDTKFHDNCQKRPRTFVLFFRNDEVSGTPDMKFEQISTTVTEYMSRLKTDTNNNTEVEMTQTNKYLFDFIKHHYGKDFRTLIKGDILNIINDNDLYDDALAYFESNNIDEESLNKIKQTFEHIQYKKSLGKNFYSCAPFICENDSKNIGACTFKTIKQIIHHKKDRLYSIREWLHLMGHPSDFELYGNVNMVYDQIGQNVPVRTAQWIVSEAVRIVNNWDTIERNNPRIMFFDNTKCLKNK